jgi:hypothetical protein
LNVADWPPGPHLAQLTEAVTRYARYTKTEQRWAEFRAATAPGPDLSLPAHRQAVLTWLNSAGCRIRYPRAGEETYSAPGYSAGGIAGANHCLPLTRAWSASTTSRSSWPAPVSVSWK